MMKKIFFFLLIVSSVFFVSSCKPAIYKHAGLLKTIPLNMIVVGKKKPDWESIASFVDKKVSLYDHRIKGSPLFVLNKSGKAKLPSEVLSTVEEALSIASESNGAFDPTIYPLTRLWDFDHGGRLPSQKEIETAKSHVDYSRLIVTDEGFAKLPNGFGLDLGGIAKGAIVDLLADYLQQLGYEQFLIEAGGDILVSGLKGSVQWKIGIKHPRKLNEFIGIVSLGRPGKRLSIVTSGDYEQYFEVDGKRYHHIIDPSTGYPAGGVVSVTVIADSCTEADALSTAAFVMGFEKGLLFLKQKTNVEALLVRERGGKLEAEETEGFPIPVSDLKF